MKTEYLITNPQFSKHRLVLYNGDVLASARPGDAAVYDVMKFK
jgi:hypothetical protein